MMCEFNCSTEYTEQLIKETVYQYQQGGSALTDDVLQPLCSTYGHPDKETANPSCSVMHEAPVSPF